MRVFLNSTKKMIDKCELFSKLLFISLYIYSVVNCIFFCRINFSRLCENDDVILH